MRQIFGEIGWEKKLLVFFVGTLILSLLGPFGTYEALSLPLRLVFWFVVMFGVGFFVQVCVATALTTTAFGQLPQIPRVLIGCVAAGLPGASVVFFVDAALRPPVMDPERLWSLWWQVSLISFGIGLIEFVDWRKGDDTPPDPIQTEFHARLPAALGRDIVSLSMQDHYVEVTTTEDSHLILMRLGDAMKELAGLPGVRIHRSHWVATHHVRDILRDGARHQVTLSDGRQLPVSQTYLDGLRAAMGDGEGTQVNA